ncbi:membrane protein insertase, YidC/Oxa1 family, C-terminal domain-containing protein [Clostridium collagenovorans DSM 3089]|uniref:Membrane protein insertase, YidC/Oxa1 family, C-terminal domain-containing protein n=1 Tax=Clostridium collagenovorans DSM 3089 TaxID=1121306 RepID=A0A1M5U529_9CLOT|nr:YidC/Oxa1 family membrane protein insertase [Clostridium collagenovorans]SHH57990.1 membrane protein insertase, YidC/Oxa1 family, C-terminal domain-containing protein [Clostridium collagenovorans DSM 3089]
MDIIINILKGILDILISFTGDLGIAIVILTLVIKICLLPLSLKQKKSIEKQQQAPMEIEKIKAKYKNNSRELDKRLQEYSKESMKNLSGCLGMFIQLPIIYALFNVFSNLNISSGSILIPWVSSLGLHDNYFIVPIIYVLTMLAPNLISYIPYFNVKGKAALNKANMISTIFIGLMFTMKTPVALGLYFISSSLFSLIEEIGYRIYSKNKVAA